MSKYNYTKQLDIPFAEAIEKVILALKEKGFGILTDVDVKKTLKEKLDVDFKQYRILGACNPPKAYKTLQIEEEIGLLLPCNIIIYEKNNGVVVSVLKPSVAFSIIDNKNLAPIAMEVEIILKQIINNL